MQIREFAERYKTLKANPTAQAEVINQAIAVGGRVPLGLRTTVYGRYSKQADAYWTRLRKAVIKTKETELDNLLVADAELRADRDSLLRLANACDRLQIAGGKTEVSLNESFLSREKKVIQGTARRKKISIRLNKDEREILKLTNQVRKKNGLGKLQLDTRLVATARDHCVDMQKHNFFAHESPVEGKATPFDRAALFGTTANAENLAAGNVTPAEVVQGWLDSPGHRVNLLQPDMKRTGVGRVGGYWTALYGL
ncbi:MAG: CAP domain-containing protein [Planctomycetota bacterium]|nr:CAP domain-containing protein [Planctomycetota bacterium]